MSDEQTTKNLSIDEAAAQLGVPARTLRTYLKRPEFDGRTVQETRQTKTGDRPATTLPTTLLADLAEFIDAWRPSSPPTRNVAERARDDAGNVAAASVPPAVSDADPIREARPAADNDMVRELLAAKDEIIAVQADRIASAEAENIDLRDRLREQQRSLDMALQLAHREQELQGRQLLAAMGAVADEKKNLAGNGAGLGIVRARMELAFNGG